MAPFLDRYLPVILLALFSVLGWVGVLRLMHDQAARPSDITWAQEKAAMMIAALLTTLTPLAAAIIKPSGKKDDSGPVEPDSKQK